MSAHFPEVVLQMQVRKRSTLFSKNSASHPPPSGISLACMHFFLLQSFRCSRCEDPTELGSFLSAVRCSQCKEEDAFLLCRFEEVARPLIWKCSGCGLQVEDEVVEERVDVLRRKVQVTSYLEPLEVGIVLM